MVHGSGASGHRSCPVAWLRITGVPRSTSGASPSAADDRGEGSDTPEIKHSAMEGVGRRLATDGPIGVHLFRQQCAFFESRRETDMTKLWTVLLILATFVLVAPVVESGTFPASGVFVAVGNAEGGAGGE